MHELAGDLPDALREAARERDAATTRTVLDAAAKKIMRAKAELKRLQPEVSD